LPCGHNFSISSIEVLSSSSKGLIETIFIPPPPYLTYGACICIKI
jgi:hypothetical protein